MLYVCIYIRTNHWEITKTPENLELCCSILYKSTNGETAQPNICVYIYAYTVCLWLHKYAFSFSFPFFLCRLFSHQHHEKLKDLEQCWKTSDSEQPSLKHLQKWLWIIQFLFFFLLLKPFYTKWCSAEHLVQVKKLATWPDESQTRIYRHVGRALSTQIVF